MKQLKDKLIHADVGEVRFDESLAQFTTWKIGGPADILIIPGSKDQLVNAIQLLYRYEMPWKQLGRGSNLLISDRGIRGVVIKLGRGMDDLRFEGNLVHASASYSFIKLAVMTGKKGLTGLEFAGGIPGSVGGAVYMNAGAHGSDVSRILKSAEIVLETGELVQYGREEMKFSYRHSILHDRPGFVIGATFELEQGDSQQIAAAMAANKARRLRTQPLQLASAGSVFRNPSEGYAAQLIEQAGLKGFRLGGAEVSGLHANFIINTGQATAEDVLALMTHIRHTVKEQFNIELVPEVLVVGER
ncbi:UDP-N-acetylmuramate dehydrogenase [Paenibacillaceae bacterium]|nr:UDP-N-acetylmuramate dehydrogenase [Paenibacillaceae bacterium]